MMQGSELPLLGQLRNFYMLIGTACGSGPDGVDVRRYHPGRRDTQRSLAIVHKPKPSTLPGGTGDGSLCYSARRP